MNNRDVGAMNLIEGDGNAITSYVRTPTLGHSQPVIMYRHESLKQSYSYTPVGGTWQRAQRHHPICMAINPRLVQSALGSQAAVKLSIRQESLYELQVGRLDWGFVFQKRDFVRSSPYCVHTYFFSSTRDFVAYPGPKVFEEHIRKPICLPALIEGPACR